MILHGRWLPLLSWGLLLAAIACSGSSAPRGQELTSTTQEADSITGSCTLGPMQASYVPPPGFGHLGSLALTTANSITIPNAVTLVSGIGAGSTKLTFKASTTINCTYLWNPSQGVWAWSSCDTSGYSAGTTIPAVTGITLNIPQPGTLKAATASAVVVSTYATTTCLTYTCNPATGVTSTTAASGTSCSDGNVCNGEETCDGSGNCKAGAPLPLTSADPCQSVTCDPTEGLKTTPIVTGSCAPSITPSSAGTPDQTTPASMSASTGFLYTGPNAVQKNPDGSNIDPSVFDTSRIAVIRGRVLQRGAGQNTPVTGATVSILNHPEYGQTSSRSPDGWFDLVVNGGGQFVVNINASGTPQVSRAATTQWQDYTILGDIVITSKDTAHTAIPLGSQTAQTHTATSITDNDGTRTARLFFPPGTGANINYADGTSQPMTGNITVRATEFTANSGWDAGVGGPSYNANIAMPAVLPPTSAMTYCAELSADEVDTAPPDDAGALATGLTFTQTAQPPILYVENFLPNAPVLDAHGQPVTVPMGTFDRQHGAWTPTSTGRIIQVLANGSGIDWNGDGQADPDSSFSPPLAVGERQFITSTYSLGQSIWRVPVPHFSSADCNWPARLPNDALPPLLPKPFQPDPDPCDQTGSIIRCQNQGLSEQIRITGTPYSLVYASERTRGRLATLSIPISQAGGVPASLESVEVIIDLQGRRFEYDIPAPVGPNQSMQWTWDRTDAYGRFVQGISTAHVSVGYVYHAVYESSPGFELAGTGYDWTNARGTTQIILWDRHDVNVGDVDASALGLGGWEIDVHHVYDSAHQTLFRGNGTRETAAASTISDFASSTYGSGGPLVGLWDIAAAPDGTLFAASGNYVVQVSRTGSISTYAGTGAAGYNGDGPANQVNVAPYAISVAPDGSIYFADFSNCRLRKIVPPVPPATIASVITVAGSGGRTYNGDGLALQVAVCPIGVAPALDGSVYFSDSISSPGTYPGYVRRLGTDGIVTTVAGNGQNPAPWANGTRAVNVALGTPGRMDVDRDGRVYFALGSKVAQLRPDGTLWTAAGTGTAGYSGDGGPATQAMLNGPRDVRIGADGTLYVGDAAYQVVRIVTPDGNISTFAGISNAGGNQSAGDGGAALAATFHQVIGIAVGQLGATYVGDDGVPTYQGEIREIQLAAGGSAGQPVVLAADGTEAYEFDSTGHHTQTVDSLRGATKVGFTYTNDLVTGITDTDGNTTTIDRSIPNTILIKSPVTLASSPRTTTITLDATTQLATAITNANGETINLGPSSTGLLNTLKDAKQQQHVFQYDGAGLLVSDQDPAGGITTLNRTNHYFGTGTDQFTGWTMLVGSADGYNTTYDTVSAPVAASFETNLLGAGAAPLGPSDLQYITTDSAGAKTVTTKRNGGQSTTVNYADGTTSTSTTGQDARWGMLSPIPQSLSVKTPSGLTMSVMIPTGGNTATLATPGQPLSVTAASDSVTINGESTPWKRVFDASSNTVTITSPQGRTLVATLDAKDRVTKIQVPGIDPYSMTYTSGRLTALSQVGSMTTHTYEYGYDPTTGFLSTVSDPAGYTSTVVSRDDVGRIKTLTLTDNTSQVHLTYDQNGNLATLIPPAQTQHNFPTYSAVDLLETYDPPDAGQTPRDTTYSYNAERMRTLTATPDGVVALSYGTDGRLAQISRGADVVQVSYADNTARVHQVSAGGLVFTQQYDGFLRTQTNWAAGLPKAHAVNITYDNSFRVKTLDVDSANSATYLYDNDNVLTSAGAITLTHDPNGALNGQLWTTSAGVINDVWTYDEFGSPQSYAANANTSQVYQATYSSTSNPRDALRRITCKTEVVANVPPTSGTTTTTTCYTYDSLGRLWCTSATADPSCSNGGDTVYGYDLNSNRTKLNGAVVAAYDPQDRLQQFNGTTYTFSNAGFLNSATTGSQTSTYTYDLVGNLRKAVVPTGTITYSVDGFNRRVGKSVNNAFKQGFVYRDNLHPEAELDAAGNVLRTFVYATQSSVPDLMVEAESPFNTYRIISDQVGSPRLVLNTATGVVAERIDYDAWGNETDTLGQETGYTRIPFGFAGGLYDPDTGFLRFGARDYDPHAGRWTSKDPINFRGGLNVYTYCANDPVNCTDPNGRFGEAAAAGVGAVAEGGGLGAAAAAAAGWTIALAPWVAAAWQAEKLWHEWNVPTVGPDPKPVSDFSRGRGKPSGCPTGTKPIDDVGLDHELIERIKRGVGNGPDDWTGVDPDGNIWVDDGTGKGVPVGNVDSF